jgi:hypothetical protein
VDRIVCCWLLLYDAETCYLQAKDMTIPQGDYHQRRIDRLHRRYLSAIRMLVVARRLALPVLYVKTSESHNETNGFCTNALENRFALG